MREWKKPSVNDQSANSLAAFGHQVSRLGPLRLDGTKAIIAGTIKVDVQANGSLVGTEHAINLVAGNGISVTGTDASNTVSLTVANNTDFFVAANRTGGILSIGQLVNVVSNGVQLASAADNTKPCNGICLIGSNPGANDTFQSQGVMTNPSWALTEGSWYYLGVTAGTLVPYSGLDLTAGRLIQKIGYAVNATSLRIAGLEEWWVL